MGATKGGESQSTRSSQLTLHTTVLLLALGSWLLLFTVELGAVANEGDEVFHPSRLGAYLTSAGFAAVTCLLVTLWCLGTSGRTFYTSVLPEEDCGEAGRSIIFWHYAIHGILVLATICWICIHSVNLQHQQVWRGILTLYSLLSLTLICFSQRRAVGRGLRDCPPGETWQFLRSSKVEDEGRVSSRKASSRTSMQRCPTCKSGRWKPLFQDPSFGGEMSEGEKQQAARNGKKHEWRSFVFEDQAEAILSPESSRPSRMLPSTYQKNLIKLRGIARRVDSDQGSIRRSSFASSDQGDGSQSVSHPRWQRTQSQPSVSSGFSDVSDCIASPSSPALLRAISKESRRVSKDSRRDSRHSAESESAMSDVSDMGHVVFQSNVLASVYEEDIRDQLPPVQEQRSEASKASPARVIGTEDGEASTSATVLRPSPLPLQGLNTSAELLPVPIPSPAASGNPFSLDSARTVNTDCVEGILQELHVEGIGGDDQRQ